VNLKITSKICSAWLILDIREENKSNDRIKWRKNMTATTFTKNSSFTGSIVKGVIAGLIGGVVFGMMMAMMGMLPMIGMLVGQENATVGFLVHMLISAGIGGTYGVIASRLPQNVITALIAGAVNGVVWWVLGALIMMPLMLGMGEMVFVVGEMQWMSLLGHLIYGVITGLAFLFLVKRS
jgi:uncharacterized membrane protein YagU involved in acid resistance